MKFWSMVQSHDDSALVALSSKGLLRRAQRDVDAGTGAIESVSDDGASITVADNQVRIDAKGPAAASCTCPAHAVCRHILVAMLLLRTQPTVPNEEAAEPALESAVFELCALTDEQIAKFAGKDMDKALALAFESLETAFEDHGTSTTVRLTELNAAITFIAGNAMKDAAYKGPKTRKRLLTTVAALAVRKREGLAVSGARQEDISEPTVSKAFIDHAQQSIERATHATIATRSLLAHDLLLDLAISTRCEALPRLSAELRSLARQAQLANQRHIEFTPEAFIQESARSYALLEALRTATGSPALSGSIRRNYVEQQPIKVWPLAAARWRSSTGARGLSAYVLDAERHRWLTLLDGRSAGADLSYDPSNAYAGPVWGLGTLSGLIGRSVELPEPRISDDGLISAADQRGGAKEPVPLTVEDVVESPACHRHWESLRDDLAVRLGSGIHRRQSPLPVLLSPKGFGRIGFNDLDQSYSWELLDATGDTLLLETPADDEESALRLWRLGRKIAALVAEAKFEQSRLTLRPVAVSQSYRGKLDIHNLDFDVWPIESGWKKAIGQLSESFSKPLVVSAAEDDAIDRVVADALELLVGIVGGIRLEKLDETRRKLEAIGFQTLDKLLGSAIESRKLRYVLRAAYAASELQSALAVKRGRLS